MSSRPAMTYGVAALLLSALTGCGSVSGVATTARATQPAVTSSAAATPVTATVPGTGDSACAQEKFTAQQFVGSWTEQDGATTTTLASDGSLSIAGVAEHTGSWSYLPLSQTPGANRTSAEMGGLCVLWLHLTTPLPASDSIYAPVQATSTSLQLSLVGRGNTLTWVRAPGR